MKRRLTYKTLTLLLCAIGALTMCSCHKKNEPVKFHRFEQLLFETKPAELQKKMTEQRADYNSPLLNIMPGDPRYMESVIGFVSDPFMREIYRLTDSCYHNIGWLEKELSPALAKARNLDDSIHYTHFYTMVTGDLEDYNNRVFCNHSDLVVSIDHYILPYTKNMGYCNCPMYIVNLSDKQYMAADCMAAIARAHIVKPEGEDLSLLDYMVMEGKVQYFLDQVMPDKHDTIKLRYSADQLSWVEHSEKDVWTYFLKNDLLYETDMARIHNFIDEAPKTNAFRNSAPRTTQYIGRQIIRKYMKKTGKSLHELFENSDSQSILAASGYKP